MTAVHQVNRLRFVNVYLVEEEDGLTLIDTAIPGSAGAIAKAADAIGKPVVRIALTHGHADHVGSLDALHEALPDAEVLISARDAKLLEKDRSPQPGDPVQKKAKGGVPGTKTRPTRTIAAGERIGSLEVLASPGHTPGHLSFIDIRDRTLYSGDAYATIGGTTQTSAKGTFLFPFMAMAAWDKGIALESAKGLRALDPSRLAPGHGPVLDNPQAARDAAIARGI
jgi:glyoxylase-like metal-dependent hydrolase (beta-lactamase superfamily II)